MRTKPMDPEQLDAERRREYAAFNYLTPTDFARRIGKRPEHVCNLIRRGKIRNVVNLGAGDKRPEYAIPPAELEAFIKRHTINAGEAA